MRCPLCDVPMREVTRRNVKIDVCTECKGVWLDRGELDHLLDAAGEVDSVEARGSLERSPARPSVATAERRSRDDDDDDDDDDDRRSGSSSGRPKKRRGWLSEMFELGE
jgi:Zn-finger nucleic acid-binding protein